MIAIACDHAGIDLKPAVIAVLDELDIPYHDFGTNSHESVDYPVYGARAARAVAEGYCDRGIVLCGTGVGISMAAGKVHGIRCVICSDTSTVCLPKLCHLCKIFCNLCFIFFHYILKVCINMTIKQTIYCQIFFLKLINRRHVIHFF